MATICQALKIIFFGTSEFGATVLEKLIESGYKPLLIVTTPDKPVGRKQIMTPPPAKLAAEKFKIPISQPKLIRNLKLEIRNLRPDLIVVSAYGQIIPKDILDIPRCNSLNVHPSLLPKYRGPSPIQTVILNGDEQTGVTIMLMDEKIDHGQILAQQELEISKSKITYLELHNQLAQLGAQLLIKTIPKWMNGEIKTVPQDDSKATFTKIIRKEDGKIDWAKSAEEIERMVRALHPWPSAYTKFKTQNAKGKTTTKNLKLLKILKTDVWSCLGKKQIGKVFLTEDKKLAVQTGKDCLIIEELQIEGKNKMTAKEFLNGHPEIIGSILR